MFYFKFTDVETQYVKDKQAKSEQRNKQYGIDPNDINISYIPWKGTTISRKTMLNNQIYYLPREFANNSYKI